MTDARTPLTQRLFEVYEELRRTKKVKNQSDFALKVGLTPTHWHGYKTGRRRANENHAQALISQFGVSARFILQGEGPIFGSLPSHNEGILPDSTGAGDRPLPGTGMEFVPVRTYRIAVLGSFRAHCHEPMTEEDAQGEIMPWPRFPGIDYSKTRSVEVDGNSMAPRYPHGSFALIRPVDKGDWQHARGIHAVSTKTEMFVIKRIDDCENGVLVMRATNPDMPLTLRIELSDINCLWKVLAGYALEDK